MRVLIIGYGVSGKSAAAFLRGRGSEVVVYDDRLFPDEPRGPFDLKVLSPGVPPDHRLAEGAISEIELGLRYLDRPAVGITGTNGKTTTTLLVTHVLNATGRQAEALGNIGIPLTSGAAGIAVIELSSFQLETTSARALDAAAITNITPDHLDRYQTFESYREAKLRIKACLKEGAPLFQGDEVAFELCRHFGVTRAEFDDACKTFIRPRHRLELVGTYDGITYINDSKATNVASVLYAMRRVEGDVVVIAGGVDKGGSYAPLVDAFQNRVKCVCCIGEAKEQIARALDGFVPVKCYTTFEEAIDGARKRCPKGGTVLLSPACSSFDMFRNYEARGDRFCEIVKEGR